MKLHLLPLLILAFIVLPVLTISGQEAPPPGRSLFLSVTAPTLDEMKLEVPPGPPVEAKNNPVPEDFRGLYQWPLKDGTKTSFQYQGFRWSRREAAGGKLWGINLVVNFGGIVKEIPGESLNLTAAAEDRLRLFLWRDYEALRANRRRGDAVLAESGQWEERILAWSQRPLEQGGSFEKSLPGLKDFGSLPDCSQPFHARVYGASGEKRGKITVLDWAMKKARTPLAIPVRIRWDGGVEELTSTEMINVTPDGSYSSANLFHLMLMRDYHRRRLEGKDLTEPALKLTAVKNMLGNWWLQTELSRKQEGEIAKTKLESWRKSPFHEGIGADLGLLPPEGYVAMEPALDRASLKPLPNDLKDFGTTGTLAISAAPFFLWWHEAKAAELNLPAGFSRGSKTGPWLAESLSRTLGQRVNDFPTWRKLPEALLEFSQRQWKGEMTIGGYHHLNLTPANLARYASGNNGCLIVVVFQEGDRIKSRAAVPVFTALEDGTATIAIGPDLISGKWKEWPGAAAKPLRPDQPAPQPPLEFEPTNPNALPANSILKKYRMFAYRENRMGIFAFSVFRKDPAVGNTGK